MKVMENFKLMDKPAQWLLTGLLLMVFSPWVASQTSVGGQPQVASELLLAIDNDEEVSFIVRFSQRANVATQAVQGSADGPSRIAQITALQSTATQSQRRADAVLRRAGATRRIQLWGINALAATANATVIKRLAQLPGVESITLDESIDAPILTELPAALTSSTVAEWNLDTIRAPDFWAQGYTGAGMVIAGMDTGVDVFHADLSPRYRGGSNSWFDPRGQYPNGPVDKAANGHGTKTMSLAVGGDAGGTALGVAPGAQWIAVKLFDDNGEALQSDIHAAFQWLLDPDGNPNTDDAPQVVNNSWGYEGLPNQCYQEFEPDLQMLRLAGISVVFSAGNLGPGAATSQSPGNNPGGFAIGSIDMWSNIATKSSRGSSACGQAQYPHVAAPGENVRVADLTFGLFPFSYTSESGTSLAAPHVAGAMALLRQAYTQATVAEIEQSLQSSATDLLPIGIDYDSGYGLIDIVAAGAYLDSLYPPPCNDDDGDLFFVGQSCGTPPDCDDQDASINPNACDIKMDGIDQNCDGRDRYRGLSCPPAGEPIIPEGTDELSCSDNIDNDIDGLADCLDSGCDTSYSCSILW